MAADPEHCEQGTNINWSFFFFFWSKSLQFPLWPVMDIFNMYKIWQKIKPSNQNEHKHGPQSTAELNSKSDRCVSGLLLCGSLV